MRASSWLFPAVETLHILGFSVLVGAIAALDARLLGLGRGLPVAPLARLLLGCVAAGFTLALPTGALLFAAQAGELVGHPVFLTKLVLVVLAGVNALVFHRRPGACMVDWRGEARPPASARVAAALSLLLWAGVLTCGRWIAYL